LSGSPGEFIDNYFITEDPVSARRRGISDGRPRFAALQRELLPDLLTQPTDFATGSHSLGARYLRRSTLMMSNLTSYQRLLLGDFAANGGKIEIAGFHTPDDFAKLREKTLINATGYGARALFGDKVNDDTAVPDRGEADRAVNTIAGLFNSAAPANS
jgi:D-amino-acid oxidase